MLAPGVFVAEAMRTKMIDVGGAVDEVTQTISGFNV